MTTSSNDEIAKKLGISTTTASRWRNDERLQKLIQQRGCEILKSSTRRLQFHMEEAVNIMVEIARNKTISPQTRMNACTAIMQQAARWTEAIDILQRIEKLEEQQNDR